MIRLLPIKAVIGCAIVALCYCLHDTNTQSYKTSSPFAKMIVGGLTSLSNLIVRPPAVAMDRRDCKTILLPDELCKGIREDFEAGYLFSGAINSNLYDERCRFTDPTLSFEGLSTFERNIAAIKPLIDKYVGENIVDLNSLELDPDLQNVKARWRMRGKILLPWKPIIDLRGRTTYTFNENSLGRIIDYFEEWDISAVAALLQLLTPTNGQFTDDV